MYTVAGVFVYEATAIVDLDTDHGAALDCGSGINVERNDMERVGRFGIGSAMLLVGATALSLAAIHASWSSAIARWFEMPEAGWSAATVVARIPYFVRLLIPFLYFWSVALWALKSYSRKSLCGRGIPSPGDAANGVSFFMLMVNVMNTLLLALIALMCHLPANTVLEDIRILINDEHWPSIVMFGQYDFVAPVPASLIPFLWVFLVSSRIWRVETDWVGRFGIVLGGLWIMVGLSYYWLFFVDLGKVWITKLQRIGFMS